MRFYADPPASVLRDLICRYGGQYNLYYSSSKVTHIIASQLNYSKICRLTNKKVVTANWITERYDAQRLSIFYLHFT